MLFGPLILLPLNCEQLLSLLYKGCMNMIFFFSYAASIITVTSTKKFSAPRSRTSPLQTQSPLHDDRFLIVLDNRGSITIIMSDVIHLHTFCNLTKRYTDEVLITHCVGISTKK